MKGIATATTRICAIVAAVVAAFAAALSGAAVDYTALEVEISSHPGRYVELSERFECADTTLTSHELELVYYGYSFTPSYNPLRSYDNIHRAYDSGDYAAVDSLCSEALADDPMSLDLNILALAAAQHLSADGHHGHKIYRLGTRCDLIATAILQSGKGTTAVSPFFVLSSSDMERVLRNVLGIDSIVDRTTVGPVDALKITFPGSNRQHILYFDNTRQQLYHNR